MDKALQREKTKERVKRYRGRQKALQNGSVTAQSVTKEVALQGRDVTQMKPLGEVPRGEIRPIVYALSDSVKREKLRRICRSLEKHNVLDKEIYYGCGGDPILMSEVSELLTAFD